MNITITPDEWLEKYHYLWDDTPVEVIKEEPNAEPEKEKPQEPAVVKLIKREPPVEVKPEEPKQEKPAEPVKEETSGPRKLTVLMEKQRLKPPVVVHRTDTMYSKKRMASTGRKITLIKK